VEQFLSKHAHAVVAGLLRWTSARFDRYPRGVEPQTAGGLPLFSLVSSAHFRTRFTRPIPASNRVGRG
jgi:hypothetical protein